METWSSRGGNTYTPTQAPTCALTKFEATENFDRLRVRMEEKKKSFFFFCNSGNLLSLEMDATDGQLNRDLTTWATSTPRQGVESCSGGMLFFFFFLQEPAGIDWSFWCLSGSLYNSHKKRFNIPEYGWTRSLVSIVTLLSISLNIALLTDFSPAQIIKHSWRGGRCVDTDNNVSDSRQWNDLLACQNKPMSRCIYSPNRG